MEFKSRDLLCQFRYQNNVDIIQIHHSKLLRKSTGAPQVWPIERFMKKWKFQQNFQNSEDSIFSLQIRKQPNKMCFKLLNLDSGVSFSVRQNRTLITTLWFGVDEIQQTQSTKQDNNQDNNIKWDLLFPFKLFVVNFHLRTQQYVSRGLG